MEGVQLQPAPIPEEAGAPSRLDRLRQASSRALTAVAAGSLAAASLLALSEAPEMHHDVVSAQEVEAHGACIPASTESLQAVNALMQRPAMTEVDRQHALEMLHGETQIPGTVLHSQDMLEYAYTNPYYKARVTAAETYGLHMISPYDTLTQLADDTADGVTLKEYPKLPLATYENVVGDYVKQFGITVSFDYEQSPEYPHRDIFDNYNTRYSMRSLIQFLAHMPVENVNKVGLKKVVFYNNPYDGLDPDHPTYGVIAGYMTPNTISVNTAFPADAGLYAHEYGHLIDDATCNGDMDNDPAFNRLAPNDVPRLSLKDTSQEAGDRFSVLNSGVPADSAQRLLREYRSLLAGDRQFYSPYGLYAWEESARDQQTEIFTKVTPSAVEEKAELAMNFVRGENSLYSVINPLVALTVQRRAQEMLARLYEFGPLWTKFMIENSNHQQDPVGTYTPPTCRYTVKPVQGASHLVRVEEKCVYTHTGKVID